MRLFLVVMVMFLVGGCKVSVRDAKVYRAELDFIDAAAEEQVERGKALISAECQCEVVEGQTVFSTAECRDLAETVLVIEARMGYHTTFMRYLGGVSKTRPPKEPPPVPEPSSLCGGPK